MNKFTLPLCLLAAASLAACSNAQVTPSSDPVVFVSPVKDSPVRPGNGKIVVLLDPTGPVNGISWQRMTLRMQDVVAQVQTLPGCRWVRLLRSTENPARLAIVEEWDSVEAHQAAEKTISPEQLKKAQNLVAKPPTGEYYQ